MMSTQLITIYKFMDYKHSAFTDFVYFTDLLSITLKECDVFVLISRATWLYHLAVLPQFTPALA